jgi:hypothetical protein
VRGRHPAWGAKTLLAIVPNRHPRWALPGRSTACDIVRRQGSVPKPRPPRPSGHPGKPTSPILAPNEVWSAACQGRFQTGDGLYCDPVTGADGHGRLLLGCQAPSSTRVAEANPVCTRLFKAFGWPQRLRTDNGVPFASTPLGRLSQLSAWGSAPHASRPANLSNMAAMSACPGR